MASDILWKKARSKSVHILIRSSFFCVQINFVHVLKCLGFINKNEPYLFFKPLLNLTFLPNRHELGS